MQAGEGEVAPKPLGWREALLFWLKLGFISFGGPAGQIAVMHQELVERRRWISERRFLHALNYCMLLPGPEAQQLATYIGWLLHRTWGGIAAGALFVLPSLLILIVLSWLYIAYGDLALVAGIFYGIKPAVTAIVLHAAHRIGSRALSNGWLWGIALASFVAIFALQLPFPLIVLGAALLGVLGGRLAPQHFALGGSHGAAQRSYGPALIDDHTPPAAHTRFRASRLALLLLIGAALWLLPMALLTLMFGWQGTLTQMGWFFTKAALLTFGGAYAVLPYVYQGAVGHYGWLTPTQMIDGLALGETTPGRRSWWWPSLPSSAPTGCRSSAPTRPSPAAPWRRAWSPGSPSCRPSCSSSSAGRWWSRPTASCASPRRSPPSPRRWWG
jgi:chromate transporter